jgi:hypothetical protein
MRRLLMVSRYFPPGRSAGIHRARVLAPDLSAYDWEPTVATGDPRDYESRLDHQLADGLAARQPTGKIELCQ